MHTFGPEELRVMGAAFDRGWEVIKPVYSRDQQSTEVGRHRLANAVMIAYRNGVKDPDALGTVSIGLMRSWSNHSTASDD